VGYKAGGTRGERPPRRRESAPPQFEAEFAGPSVGPTLQRRWSRDWGALGI